MIKKDKGITLISLSIAVIIILTITGMILYSAKDNIYIKNLTNMENDIANLRDKISLYYSEYGDIPAQTEYQDITNLENAGVIGANDTGKFYIIELEKLDGLTLNYGEDYEKYKANGYTYSSDLTDIYIINENSHNIFFVEGIRVKENDETKMYYTDYTEGDKETVILKESQDWHEETNEDGETIITNGVAQLKIGDYVNYDPTNGGKITTTYTSPRGTYHEDQDEVIADMSENMIEGNGYGNQTFSVSANTNGWRILGIDEQTNEILLVSTDAVKTTEDQYFYLKGQTAAEWGEKELNDICTIYGKGKGASGARSITVEDINKITGYDPEVANCFAGEFYEYGNEMTYTKNGETVTYVGTKNGNGTFSAAFREFRYYDSVNKIWKSLGQQGSITLKSTAYGYVPNTLTTNPNDPIVGISKSSPQYELLFSDTSNGEEPYWLASSYLATDAGENGVSSNGLRFVSNEMVMVEYLFDAACVENELGLSIRPVISLDADIAILQQQGTSDNPHQIQ